MFLQISGKEDLRVPVLSAESRLEIMKYLLHKTLPNFGLVHLMMWVNTEETLAVGGFMSTNVKNKNSTLLMIGVTNRHLHPSQGNMTLILWVTCCKEPLR